MFPAYLQKISAASSKLPPSCPVEDIEKFWDGQNFFRFRTLSEKFFSFWGCFRVLFEMKDLSSFSYKEIKNFGFSAKKHNRKINSQEFSEVHICVMRKPLDDIFFLENSDFLPVSEVEQTFFPPEVSHRRCIWKMLFVFTGTFWKVFSVKRNFFSILWDRNWES